MEDSTSLDDIFENVRPQSTAFTVVLMAICLVPMVLLVTWHATLIRSWPSEPGSGKEPPVAPYSIPYLQHMISFLLDPYGLLQSLREKYPETPFTLTMMNTKFHVFSSPVTAAKIFGKSREYAFEPVIASMMQNGVNLPPQDLVKFTVHKRSPGSHSGKEDSTGEFVSLNHGVYIKYLSGKRLDKGLIPEKRMAQENLFL
ncbi:hypothetical protein V491_00486 [Pseudogymnoascus sp. VKM F-3775]|nr:hypothetical protein V491_00486 [Pseudogymnoascus sp. VKM F-3775]